MEKIRGKMIMVNDDNDDEFHRKSVNVEVMKKLKSIFLTSLGCFQDIYFNKV